MCEIILNMANSWSGTQLLLTLSCSEANPGEAGSEHGYSATLKPLISLPKSLRNFWMFPTWSLQYGFANSLSRQ